MFYSTRCKTTARVRLLRADQRGTVAVMMGLLLPILVGGLGLGFEVSNWYLQTRAMQNAADAAVIAAATNADPNYYGVEAKAVAALYGFVDGSNNVHVWPLNNAPCPTRTPSLTPPCYIVTITSVAPLYLSQVVGFKGDTTLNGANAIRLGSAATAIPQIQEPICLLALDTSGTAFRSNGGPKTDFTGCTIMSNANATCNGSNLLATYGIAVGKNGGGAGCGITQISGSTLPPPGIKPLTNPGCPTTQNPTSVCYDQILANSGISTTALGKCGGSYGTKGVYTQLAKWSQLPSFQDSNNNTVYVACGDTQLSSGLTAPPGSVLVVENGNLDLGGQTLSGSAFTLVFSGTADTKKVIYGHEPTGSGTLDIQGPSPPTFTSSTSSWLGVALYQDPSLTGTGVDVSYAGNNPTWNISGLAYMPNSSVTISGAINKSAQKGDCFVQIAKDILINGTGLIYAQTPDGSGCKSVGLIQPTVTIGNVQLVN
jgi:Putative Flp pilus-assembly TadE/G-like